MVIKKQIVALYQINHITHFFNCSAGNRKSHRCVLRTCRASQRNWAGCNLGMQSVLHAQAINCFFLLQVCSQLCCITVHSLRMMEVRTKLFRRSLPTPNSNRNCLYRCKYTCMHPAIYRGIPSLTGHRVKTLNRNGKTKQKK